MSGKTVLMMNGRYVEGREGETILQIARRCDVFIPTLCHVEGLSAHGACRLCLVEVKGINRLLPACATRGADGMEVTTDSPKLQRYRQTVLELLFSERNHVCAVCVSNGHCELQAMAQKLGVNHINLPYRYPRLPYDSSHDRFRMDHSRCILCTRCVRACAQIEGAHTKDVINRGIDSLITTDHDVPWGQSTTCTACGKCVHVCPTGALTEKGASTGEMVKRPFLPQLATMRENQHA